MADKYLYNHIGSVLAPHFDGAADVGVFKRFMKNSVHVAQNATKVALRNLRERYHDILGELKLNEPASAKALRSVRGLTQTIMESILSGDCGAIDEMRPLFENNLSDCILSLFAKDKITDEIREDVLDCAKVIVQMAIDALGIQDLIYPDPSSTSAPKSRVHTFH